MFTSATYNLLILYISFLKQQQSYFSDSTFVDFYEFRKKCASLLQKSVNSSQKNLEKIQIERFNWTNFTKSDLLSKYFITV